MSYLSQNYDTFFLKKKKDFTLFLRINELLQIFENQLINSEKQSKNFFSMKNSHNSEIINLLIQ